METSATRGCEHGRACDDYCPECEIDGLSDTIVKLRAEITRLTTELAHTDAKVRALGAWKIAAIEILFRMLIDEPADEQDIAGARELLDREE